LKVLADAKIVVDRALDHHRGNAVPRQLDGGGEPGRSATDDENRI
jgi:hypothetical protein